MKNSLLFILTILIATGLYSCTDITSSGGDSENLSFLKVASSKPSKTIKNAQYWVMDEGKFVWRILESDIKGFDFEEGYECKIAVTKESDGKYRLNQILNKEKKKSVVPLISMDPNEFGGMVFNESDDWQRSISTTRSATLANAARYWTNGDVYYVFDSNFDDSLEVKYAMNTYQNNTGLRFFPGHGNGNYIRFRHGTSNYSDGVGMLGGQQIVTLANNYVYGHALHEIGHSIGLFHEQNRTDRDNYITILWDNIQSSKRSQFVIDSNTRDVCGFDFASVMLYPSDAFSKQNGLNTMVCKNNYSFRCQRDSLSEGDIEGVKSIYGPPFTILESDMEVVDEYVDAALDYYDTEVTYTIRICEDRNGLVSSSLTYPRDIRIKRVVETANSSSPRPEINTYYDYITLPAGTTTYTVGTYENIEHLRNGNPEEIRITSLTLQ